MQMLWERPQTIGGLGDGGVEARSTGTWLPVAIGHNSVVPLGSGIHGQTHTPAAGARVRDWADQGALTAEQPPITCGSGLVLPHHIPSSRRPLRSPAKDVRMAV